MFLYMGFSILLSFTFCIIYLRGKSYNPEANLSYFITEILFLTGSPACPLEITLFLCKLLNQMHVAITKAITTAGNFSPSELRCQTELRLRSALNCRGFEQAKNATCEALARLQLSVVRKLPVVAVVELSHLRL